MNRPDLKCRRCGAAAVPIPTGWDAFNHTDDCRGVVILEGPGALFAGKCEECAATGGHLPECPMLQCDPRFEALAPETQEAWLSGEFAVQR